MVGFLQAIGLPALVSLFISLWVSKTLEDRRARREHITRLFEQARVDVKTAIENAIDYFTSIEAERTPLKEARVLASDRELRAGLTLLLQNEHAAAGGEASNSASHAFTSLLIELTGGSFQTAANVVDGEHLNRLVYAGARMRSELARLRDAELRDRVTSDPVPRARRAIFGRLQSWFYFGSFRE